jgi:hypothetical protein
VDLEIEQMDVQTAFLYGDIDGDVYMEQPSEFDDGTGLVCKLNKALYGLKQAPRIWYETLKGFLLAEGFKHLESDHGIFVKDGIIMAVYMDDLLLIGQDMSEISKLKQRLSVRFDMTDLGPCSYYLGMSIRRNRRNRAIYVSQEAYIDKVLKNFDMTQCHPIKIPMDSHERLTSTARGPYCYEGRAPLVRLSHRVIDVRHALHATRYCLCCLCMQQVLSKSRCSTCHCRQEYYALPERDEAF